jgi:hypothetical protein
MEKDIANYTKYKMGFSQKIILTDEAVPLKFHCQEDRKKRLCGAGTSRALFVKRQRRDIIKECEEQYTRETAQNEENILQKTLDESAEIEDETPESMYLYSNSIILFIFLTIHFRTAIHSSFFFQVYQEHVTRRLSPILL